MRELERNKITVYYAKLLEYRPITDSEGYKTGELEPVYSSPTELKINVSPASGESATRQFGTTVDYDRTLVICDKSISINEQTVMWVDEKDTSKPFDYVVKRVAPSLNSLLIAIKKVEVS